MPLSVKHGSLHGGSSQRGSRRPAAGRSIAESIPAAFAIAVLLLTTACSSTAVQLPIDGPAPVDPPPTAPAEPPAGADGADDSATSSPSSGPGSTGDSDGASGSDERDSDPSGTDTTDGEESDSADHKDDSADAEKPSKAEVDAGLREIANQAGGSKEHLEPYYGCVVDELYGRLDAEELHLIADGELPSPAIDPLRESVSACLDKHGSP